MVEQNTEATEATTEQVTHLQFIAAFVASKKDGTGLVGVAQKTGLEKGTCQTRASNIRNGSFKMVNKLDGELTVYRATDASGLDETTDKELAKVNTQGKLIPIKVKFVGEDGNTVVTVRPIPLPKLEREGGKRNEAQYDEAMALLASLTDES